MSRRIANLPYFAPRPSSMRTVARFVQRLPTHRLATRHTSCASAFGLRISHYSNEPTDPAPGPQSSEDAAPSQEKPKSAYKRFRADLMMAMRNKDTATVNPLKALLTDFNAREKRLKLEPGSKEQVPNDTILAQVIHHQIAKRKDSIASFAQYHRIDLVEKEENEIRVLEQYLPVGATSDEDIRALVKEAFETLRMEGRGANDPGSMSPSRIFRWLFEDEGRKERLGSDRCDQTWMRRVVIDEIKALSDRPDGILEDLIKVRSKKEGTHLEMPKYQ